jgi:hypothetical protein
MTVAVPTRLGPSVRLHDLLGLPPLRNEEMRRAVQLVIVMALWVAPLPPTFVAIGSGEYYFMLASGLDAWPRSECGCGLPASGARRARQCP